jgi:RNA polymerase sigma-70 factor (ECF subfamily)
VSNAEFDVAASLEAELDALWRFAMRITANNDDASDLVQRTCVRALEKRSTYTPNGKFRSWLFQIQHRIWLNELRSRKMRAHDSLDTAASTIESSHGTITALSADNTSDTAHTNVFLEQVYEAVNKLPEAQRVVMILVNVEGCSYREAADILDVPIGTIMSRLARARVTIGKLQSSNAQAEQTTSPQFRSKV